MLGESHVVAASREKDQQGGFADERRSIGNIPDKSFRIEIRSMVREIHAWHGVEVIGALNIPQRQRAGQVGHGHGVEALHGDHFGFSPGARPATVEKSRRIVGRIMMA